MKKFVKYSIMLLLCYCQFNFYKVVLASEKQVSVRSDLGVDKLYGYTKYQIGGLFKNPDGTAGSIPFPISELRFPLDIYLLYIRSEVVILNKIIFQFTGKTNMPAESEKVKDFFKGDTNITSGAGNMEDSDWGYWAILYEGKPEPKPANPYSFYSLDVYSRGEARVRARSLEGDCQYQVYKKSNLSLNIGIGLLYQMFDYDIFNSVQQYPSYIQYSAYLNPKYSSNIELPGKVLTYKVEYYIPFISFYLRYDITNNWEITGNIKVSPGIEMDNGGFNISFHPVRAQDEDNHILGKKLGEGNSKGEAVSLSFGSIYKLTYNIHIGLSLNYMFLKTIGHQKQTRYQEVYEDGVLKQPGPMGTIENELETQQLNLGIDAGISF